MSHTRQSPTKLLRWHTFAVIFFLVFIISIFLPPKLTLITQFQDQGFFAFLSSLNTHTFDHPVLERLIGSLCLATILFAPAHRLLMHISHLNPPVPPSILLTATVGRLQYLCKSKDYQILYKNFDFPIPRLAIFGGRQEYDLINLEHENITPLEMPSKRYHIITGPPGVGKTTYLQSQLKKLSVRFDLIVRLAPFDVADAFRPDGLPSLWPVIIRRLIKDLPNTFGSGTNCPSYFRQLLITYIVNRKRVLFVIEDIHVFDQTAKELHLGLEEYFRTYHGNSPHLRVLCTTRENELQLRKQLDEDVEYTHLAPLSERRAQELFYKLCRALSVSTQDLLEHAELLQVSFSSEAIRVPLFIAISAALVSPRRPKPVDIRSVLNMTTSQLLDHYIVYLCDHSYSLLMRVQVSDEADDETAKDFLRKNLTTALSDLSHNYWPKWVSIERSEFSRELRVALARTELPTQMPIDVDFLVLNGFLIPDQITNTAVSFPHQVIGDYLAARHMVGSRDFKLLEAPRSNVRLEGMRGMFRELVEDGDSLSKLMYSDMEGGLVVLQMPGKDSLIRGLSGKHLGREAARWALPGAPRYLHSSVWSAIRSRFDQHDQGAWVQGVVEEVTRHARLSEEHIVSLSMVGLAEVQEIVEKWLEKSESEKRRQLLLGAARNEKVRLLLRDVFARDGLESQAGRIALIVLWKATGELQRPERESIRADFDSYAVDLLKNRKRKHIEKLLELRGALGNAIVARVAKLSEDEPIEVKRVLSDASAKVLGKFLLCAGEYSVWSEHEDDLSVEVKRSLLVPCMISKGDVNTYRDGRSARSDMGKKVQHLLLVEEAKVALQHYRFIGPERAGFIPFSNGSEAFQEEAGQVGLYFVPATSGTSTVVSTTKVPDRMETLVVGHRRIEPLHVQVT